MFRAAKKVLNIVFCFAESSCYSVASQELSRRRVSDSEADPGIGAERRRSENVKHKNISFGKTKGHF